MSKKLLLITAISLLAFSACSGKSYDKEVDISEEKRAEYEASLAKYSDKIENFVSTTNEDGTPDLPDFDWFLEKSRAEKELGHVDAAIDTLEEAIDVYSFSSIALHNLAKIYQNAGECEIAEEYYKELINIEKPAYHYDIAYCYMKYGNNISKVQEHYFKYKLSFPDNSDPEVENFLIKKEDQ